MKIKKKTSIMMLATALVAVVGIAAVSFAAWAGGFRTVTANAASGEVYFFGFATQPSAIGFDTLVPYDQPAASIKDNAKTVATTNIPEFTALAEEYTITVEATTNTAGLRFFVRIDAQGTDVTAPTSEPTADDANWKEVKAVGGVQNAVFTLGDTAGAQNLQMSIILVSNEPTQMNKTATLTVTLASPSAGTPSTTPAA